MGTPLTDDEAKRLVDIFNVLDVKPKMDSPEDLTKWMADYIQAKQPTPLTTTSQIQYTHATRITPFSGTKDKEISYESWRYEVETYLKEGAYSRTEVASAAKKSLRGEASDAVRRLGVTADLNAVFKKLDGIYGAIENQSELMKEFFAAEQGMDESVAAFSC